MPRTFAQDDDSVVVVIGSGAGGATLANALAQRSIDVVCLEAGKRLSLDDIVNDEAIMFHKLTWLDERIGEHDNIPHFPVWTCKTVGGTTMHWTACSPRLQTHELQASSTYGDIKGTSFTDWPFRLDELNPYYDRAEDLMGVTGTHGIDYLPGNNNYKVLEAAARKAGYTQIDTNNVAINSASRDGRPGCLQLGFCTSGCVSSAKWSTLYTEIPKAEQTSHFELRSECMAVNINSNSQGRVTGVQYRDASGRLQQQRARIVCVAGNAVETTRLLLLSRTKQFPDGLANSSGQLGRNYMRHVISAVVGVMPGEVHLYKGAQVAGIVKDEAVHDASRGFFGGFLMMTVNFTPETLARLLMPSKWGNQISSVLERYRNLAAMLIVGEDPPQADNRITLHPTRKDQSGLPVPVISYTHHENSLAMRNYALDTGRKMYESLGATQTFDMVDVFPATHNMGTARMGDNPATSVCNRWGQSHDISNLFVSDGSLFPTVGCENPTLTIVALVLRQADYIAQQINTKRL